MGRDAVKGVLVCQLARSLCCRGSSPRRAGTAAYEVGAAGHKVGSAIDWLGPLGQMPLRPIEQTAFQLGRDSNPYGPSDTGRALRCRYRPAVPGR
jgi:hypothetical protein